MTSDTRTAPATDTGTAPAPETRTATATGRPVPRRRMDPLRRVALAGGVLYLITFVASIPALWLYADVLDHPDYITTAGSNTPLLWGAWLEIVTAVACIGTAVALYPVTKRVSQTAALGFVTARVVEATLIVVGVLSLLSIGIARYARGPRGEDPDLPTAPYTKGELPRWPATT